MRLNRNNCIQVRMCTRGVYVLNKGAWPNARLCDCSRNCMLQSSKRRLLFECESNADIAISTNSKMLESWTNTRYLCCARSKFVYVLIHEMHLTVSIRPTKQYALISEYALISDMHLITRNTVLAQGSCLCSSDSFSLLDGGVWARD